MISAIQITLLALFGRLTGSDVGGRAINKSTMALASGLIFLPDIVLSAVVAVGLLLGHALRDSIFALLTGWDSKAALRMTYRAASFLPLMLVLYVYGHGLEITPAIALCFVPMLTRAPIQYLCRFIPLPIAADKNGKWYVQLFLGKAEMYELIYSAAIAVAIVSLTASVQFNHILMKSW